MRSGWRAAGSGGRLAGSGSGTYARRTEVAATAVERRPHEEQTGAARQPVSVPLLRRRRACRLRESQHAPTALEEPRGARCRRPWRCRNRCQTWQDALPESLAGSATGRCSIRSAIWIVVLLEHDLTGGISNARCKADGRRLTDERRCAPASRSRSPDSAFTIAGSGVQLHRNAQRRLRGAKLCHPATLEPSISPTPAGSTDSRS